MVPSFFFSLHFLMFELVFVVRNYFYIQWAPLVELFFVCYCYLYFKMNIDFLYLSDFLM